ncbi:MAG: hypothetical protein ACRAVC_13265 [Trichormus sp.]
MDDTPMPMPHAPCPMPHAPCPMPHAPLPRMQCTQLRGFFQLVRLHSS